MRPILLLVVVAVASAQFPFNRGFRRNPFRQQQQFQFNRPPNRFAAPVRAVSGGGGGGGGGAVHGNHGGSQYHYSWRVDGGRKYTHGGAVGYCRQLGGSWQAVSIEDRSESDFINQVIGRENQAYIWTSGTKRGRSWVWGNGSPVSNINWSRTGFTRRPQPDNRDGNENCLAILNRFYEGDTITWHDVGCEHTKPVVCESR
ncbi:C-type lectin mannose-binding isoform-like [Penaeus chinensis]|uniref:C-type lectin mannose-binding isoform-like n=1 Tax=Penaeus chinensis TaxID=139456 RepID=UPI001FB67BE4|nr:C-type lectin mannose-binding isoform-like [Penaeus chinensis]